MGYMVRYWEIYILHIYIHIYCVARCGIITRISFVRMNYDWSRITYFLRHFIGSCQTEWRASAHRAMIRGAGMERKRRIISGFSKVNRTLWRHNPSELINLHDVVETGEINKYYGGSETQAPFTTTTATIAQHRIRKLNNIPHDSHLPFKLLIIPIFFFVSAAALNEIVHRNGIFCSSSGSFGPSSSCRPLGIPFIINWWQRWSIYACDFGASTKHKYFTWHMSTWQSIRSMVRRRPNGLHDIWLGKKNSDLVAVPTSNTKKNYTPQVKMFRNKKKQRAHFKLRWKRKILSNTITIGIRLQPLLLLVVCSRSQRNAKQWQRETVQGQKWDKWRLKRWARARTTCKIIIAIATRRI